MAAANVSHPANGGCGLFLFWLRWLRQHLLPVKRRQPHKKKRRHRRKKKSPLPFAPPGAGNRPPPVPELFQKACQLRRQLTAIIRQAALQACSKEQLAFRLNRQLCSYPELRHTAFQIAIDHFISQQCHQQLGLRLERSEIDRLWSAPNTDGRETANSRDRGLSVFLTF